MNAVHAAVITHVRAAEAARGGKTAKDLVGFTDEQMMRIMFASARGQGAAARGLRLTNAGLDLMERTFQCFKVEFPKNRQLQTGELLYLDRQATLPYYCSDRKVVVFETMLGMKIKLWDGAIMQIAEVEGYDPIPDEAEPGSEPPAP